STGRTGTLRVKEDADDYRYFPEPDLVPLEPSAEDIARIDAALPALPAARRTALAAAAGVDPTVGGIVIAVERGLDALAAAAIAAGADAARVLTHVEHNLAVEGAESLSAGNLAALVTMETSGELTATQAKTVLAEVVATGKAPAEVAQARGFEALDSGALEGIVDGIIADHPDEWEQFRTGDDKARGKLTGFFMGKVMQASKGQADGKAATALLRARASR
ncbi:MAG: Asp-tRNA(Asn)/Glu-tRNA(Gln) amidotransferase subunit GatB, partial [Acidimicrobiales bacterium]